jgi:hypothetical protein
MNDDEQGISRPASSLIEHRDHSPRISSSPVTVPIDTIDERSSSPLSKPQSSILKGHDVIPVMPVDASSAPRDYEQGRLIDCIVTCLFIA